MALTIYFDPDGGRILAMEDEDTDPYMIVTHVTFCPCTQEEKVIEVPIYDDEDDLTDETSELILYRVPYNMLGHVKFSKYAGRWPKKALAELIQELNCVPIKKEVLHERYRS